VPLSFCAECKKNRRPEVDARIAKHKEWFKQLIKERDASLSQEQTRGEVTNKNVLLHKMRTLR
jgi:ribosome-associated translation inhibitor RaiA